MSVGTLLERLRADAASAGTGRIRVDEALALRKLREHRLAEPHHYVLDLLRAAEASGASLVEIRCDADEMEMSFDGRPFPEEEIANLFGHALAGASAADAEATRLRLLALGVVGALGLRPRSLVVQSGARHLDVTAERVAARPRDPARGKAPVTRVYVRERLGWRVAGKALRRTPPEVVAVHERTAHFGPRIEINGALLPPRPAAGTGARHPLELTEAGRRIHLALIPRAPGRIQIATHGVTVAERSVDIAGLPVAGWASDERLRVNASGSDVVEGAELASLLAAVEGAAVAIVQRLVDAVGHDPAARDEVARIALDVGLGAPGDTIDEVRSRSARGGTSRGNAGARIAAILRRAPLFPGPAGEWWSLHDLGASGPVRTLAEPCDPALYDGAIVLWPAASLEARALLAGRPWTDARDEVVEGRGEALAKTAFERQPVERAELPAGDDLARRSFEKGKLRGEVAISAGATGSVVRFLHRGRLVEQRDIAALHPLDLRAVVDAPDLPPDPRGSGIAKGAPVEKAIAAVREAALLAVGDLLGAPGGAPRSEVAAFARRALAALPKGRGAGEALSRARIFPRAGGGASSLEELRKQPRVRWISEPAREGALDGEPVVVLSESDRAALAQALGKKVPLVRYDEQLARELEVQARIGKENVPPVITDAVVVRASIQGAGLHGEIGLLPDGPERIAVTLLRKGFVLECCRIPNAAAPLVAVVESPDLTPRPTWDGAVKDAAYERTMAAVRAAVPDLLAALAAAPGTIDAFPVAALRLLAGAILRNARAVVEACAPGAGDASGETAACLATKVDGSRGPTTLHAVAREARASGSLATVASRRDLERLGGGLALHLVPDVVADALAAVLGAARDAERRAADAEMRRRHAAKPALPWQLSGRPAATHEIEHRGLRVLVGHVSDGNPGIAADVRWQQRRVTMDIWEHGMPLAALVELPDALEPGEIDGDTLSDALAARVEEALGKAAVALAGAAVTAGGPGAPDAARTALALDAIGAGLGKLEPRLLDAALFPTLGGAPVAAAALSRTPIPVVASPDVPPDGEATVVVASSPRIARALRALGPTRDVTDELEARGKARARFARKARAAEIAVTGKALARRRIARAGIEGEVAIVKGTDPEVDVYHDGRHLVTRPLAWPAGARAALQATALRPSADLRDVADPAALSKVERLLHDELDALLAEKAEAVAVDERRAVVASLLAPFLPWLSRRSGGRHALMRAPLFTTTEGVPVSVDALRGSRPDGVIAYSRTAGTAPRSAGLVLHPRKDELPLLEQLGRLEDVSALVADLAARRAARRPVPATVPGRERVREPVAAGGGAPLEGEVAVGAAPSMRLELGLIVGGSLVETVDEAHPVGGRARVRCDLLSLDADERQVLRDRELARVRQAVDAALERAVARILAEGRKEEVSAWLPAALGWRLDGAGPVADVVRRIPAFRDIAGAALTVGAVLAEQDEHGEVHVLTAGVEGDPGWPCFPAGRPVLVLDARARELLGKLDLQLRDHAEEAKRHAELLARRAERRIGRRRHEGDAVVRLPVNEQGYAGEIALPAGDLSRCHLILAKEGLAVDEYRQGQLVLAGVLECAALPVNAAGDRAELDETARHLLATLVGRLFDALVAKAPTLPPALRRAAAFHVLRAVTSEGAARAGELARLGARGRELARLPLFESAEGQWHDLATLAALAESGEVVVLSDARGSSSPPVIHAPSAAEPWVAELETFLGKGATLRIPGAAALRRHLARRAPPKGSALHAGLELLSREAKSLGAQPLAAAGLLRSFGVARSGGATAFTLERAPLEVLLDLDHAGLRQALESGDVESIRIVLATILGAVNRARGAEPDESERALARVFLRARG